MIKSIVAIIALALGAIAPVWAQEPKAAEGEQVAPSAGSGGANFHEELDKLLKSVERDPASGRQVTRAPTHEEVARRDEFSKTIFSQMISNGCWGDQSALTEGRKLDVLIGVEFGRDGRFVRGPSLLIPRTIPADDPVMQTFAERAFAGLRKCEAIGFTIPPQYFDRPILLHLSFMS